MSRVKDYLANAKPEFIPILEQLRELLLSGEFALEEGWKWNAPSYAANGMVCWLAHFKGHVGLNFFKGSLIEDKHGLYDDACSDKGNRMIKFRSLSDVDADKLSFYIVEAIRLNLDGVKVAKREIPTDIPSDLAEALASASDFAREFFESLAPSYKRDYLEWITSAKREVTREKHLATTIEWLSEGKKKNWKYEKC